MGDVGRVEYLACKWEYDTINLSLVKFNDVYLNIDYMFRSPSRRVKKRRFNGITWKS